MQIYQKLTWDRVNKGFTLIETLVTMFLICILAGMSTVFLMKPKSDTDLLEESAFAIVDSINQVMASSLNIDTPKNLCSISSGGTTCAIVNEWSNLNKKSFDPKVMVTVYNSGTSPLNLISQIQYTKGIISRIVYSNGSTIDISSTNENNINPITFYIKLRSNNSTCYVVYLWPNNVTKIDPLPTCTPP